MPPWVGTLATGQCKTLNPEALSSTPQLHTRLITFILRWPVKPIMMQRQHVSKEGLAEGLVSWCSTLPCNMHAKLQCKQ